MQLWFISYIPFCDRLSTFIALLSECGTPTSTAAKTLQLGCMRVCVSVCGRERDRDRDVLEMGLCLFQPPLYLLPQSRWHQPEEEHRPSSN